MWYSNSLQFICSESWLCNVLGGQAENSPVLNKHKGLRWCGSVISGNEIWSRKASLSNDSGVWAFIRCTLAFPRKTVELQQRYKISYQQSMLPHIWLANTAHCWWFHITPCSTFPSGNPGGLWPEPSVLAPLLHQHSVWTRPDGEPTSSSGAKNLFVHM